MVHGGEERPFFDLYTEYLEQVLEPTRLKVKAILSKWREPSYWIDYAEADRGAAAPSPIQRVRVRLKRPESARDKLYAKGLDLSAKLDRNHFATIHDALGARVIVYFTSQLRMIDLEIRNSGDFEISTVKPPVAYLGSHLQEELGLTHIERRRKHSGYASIHYILRLSSPAVQNTENPWFEIQLRTLCEDLWGEIEHVLGYKPQKRTSFAVRQQFRIISRSLEAIDDHFNFLYEELSRYQHDAVIADSDPLNAENLPAVLREMNVGCAQGEVDFILRNLGSRGITKTGDLRNVGTDARIDAIRDVYRSVERRDPLNMEIAANLANLVGVPHTEDITDRVRAHISYFKTWSQMVEQKKRKHPSAPSGASGR